MTRHEHGKTRERIVLAEGSPDSQHRPPIHLEECGSCQDYAEAVRRAVSTLRSIPLTADSRLVRATQQRVRLHASRLREASERTWLVAMACFGVGVSAVVTSPLSWLLFSWVADRTGLSHALWQTAWVFFQVAPATTVSVILAGRGALLDRNGEPS
jgi:hypothetical protein